MNFEPLGYRKPSWHLLLCLWFLSGLFSMCFGQLGEIAPAVPYIEQPEQTYTLYRPSQYTRKKRWPAVVLLDASGNGQAAVSAFRQGAESYGFILAAPNGFQLHSDMDIRDNPVIWVYQDLIRRFAVDIEGIYFAGMGEGNQLMADLTKRLQTNAGLILCSPEPIHLELLKPFPTTLALSQGFYDSNTAPVKKYLKKHALKKPYRFVSFEGGRQWPENDAASELLGWLMVQTYQSRNLDMPHLDAWFQRRSDYAKNLVEQHRLLEAQDAWEKIHQDFSKTAHKDSIKKAFGTLSQSQALKEQEKARNAATMREIETLAIFKKHTKPELYDQTEALEQNLNWWKQQQKTLDYLLNESPDLESRHSAIRLVETMWQISYLEGLNLLETERFATASYHFNLATHLFPDKSFAHYGLACAYAGLDESAKALSALAKSIDMGLQDESLVQLQPLFDNLRSRPEFKVISQRLRN